MKGATDMDGTNRSNIKVGMLVDIVLKADQRTGKLTRGHVSRLITNSPHHHRGIKVELAEGKGYRTSTAYPTI